MSQLFGAQRKLSNVILTKKFHLRYYGLWFLISIMMVSLLALSVYLVFEEHWRGLLYQDPSKQMEYLFDRSRFVYTLVLISALLAIAITFLGIFTTHRIAGPLIKLQRAFEAVRDGNLDYRLKFRDGDELIELEVTFNEMMDTVNKKVSGQH